jgi:phage antirepressor YoqD-like protein
VLDNNNLPKQRYIERGLFKVVAKSYRHPVVGDRHYGQTMVTDKGLAWIRTEFQPQPEQKVA